MSIRPRRQARGTDTVTISCDKCETRIRVHGAATDDHRHARAIAARSGWRIWDRRPTTSKRQPTRDLCPAHPRTRGR